MEGLAKVSKSGHIKIKETTNSIQLLFEDIKKFQVLEILGIYILARKK